VVFHTGTRREAWSTVDGCLEQATQHSSGYLCQLQVVRKGTGRWIGLHWPRRIAGKLACTSMHRSHAAWMRGSNIKGALIGGAYCPYAVTSAGSDCALDRKTQPPRIHVLVRFPLLSSVMSVMLQRNGWPHPRSTLQLGSSARCAPVNKQASLLSGVDTSLTVAFIVIASRLRVGSMLDCEEWG
jgi:hypothetical protein